MKKAIKIGFYVHKGGTGKSSAVINTAYNLNKRKKKVLVVDCDSQRNSFSFFQSRKPSDVSVTTWDNYITASDKWSGYNYVLFDLPPAMNDEVRKIIRHCDSVFVPVVLGFFEVSGLADVTAEIQKQGAKLGGVFASMYNKQNKDYETLQELQSILKTRLMNTVIPYSKTVRESQKDEVTVEEYFINKNVPRNRFSWKIVNAYEALAHEIIERCKL